METARVKLLRDIEKARGSRVLSYVTGDRQGLTTVIGDDAVRVLYPNLEAIGNCEQLDLFLYSRGGTTLAPYRMVQLMREYCKKLCVLVPYRAHSAATLLCLGADEIVMGRLGELSPVDPAAANPFNPPDPVNPMGRVPISVEDVISYLSLAREKASLTDPESLREVFKSLTEKVHPLALGNIQRSHSLIRLLARKLLALHLDPQKHKSKIEATVETLTEKLYTHDYAITRYEAKNSLDLKIVYADSDLEALMWRLYEEYEKDLKIREPFNPTVLLGENTSVDFSMQGAVIESTARTDAFHFEGMFTRTNNPAVPFIANMKVQEWRKVR